MKTFLLSGACVFSLALVAGVWLARQAGAPSINAQHDTLDDAATVEANAELATASPFGVVNSPDVTSDGDVSEEHGQSGVSPETVVALSDEAVGIPAWGVKLNESQLGDIVARLRADPALLQRLIDEFRQETDIERKQQLALVLGAVGGEQATLVASELIFSGDSDERTLGMDLLQSIQPGNAQAREIVSGMLANEVEPESLIDAMTALSRPGDVDRDSRAFLSDQLALLTSHEDDGVRSISLDILSRWSDDGRYTDTLLVALDDSAEYVRGSAAYALAGHEDTSPVVIERLFTSVRTVGESKSVKQAAIFALRSMPLTSIQSAELDDLERRLNTVRR